MKKFLLKIYYRMLDMNEKFVIFYNKNIVAKRKPPIVIDIDGTLNKLINDKCSISRYGDGEFALMRGRLLKFQPYNKVLAEKLKEIILCDDLNYMVCIPDIFFSNNILTENAQKYWNKYLNFNRRKIYKLLDKNKKYYDSLVTRLYIDIKDKEKVKSRFDAIKLLWKDSQVLIIEGDKSRLGVGNDLFKNAATIERIICPSVDAFSKYDEILKKVLQHDKSKLVLIALGPTATVLAYDLFKFGYQAVDIGHIDIEYEWFLMGATEKCPVKNKYIGEINGGDVVASLSDVAYESQMTAIL